MAVKNDELKNGLLDPSSFNPAHHIFNVLNRIQQSQLFHIIRRMPKGGILHIHELAMCSADYLVSLTYWTDLWQRTSNNSNHTEIKEVRFSRKQPENPKGINGSSDNDSMWQLVKDVRTKMGASIYDKQLRALFTLYDPESNPTTQFKDVNEVWDTFEAIFNRIKSILSYKPVLRAYYKRAFRDMYEDGVQYVEIRSSLSQVQDLDGNYYTEDETIQIYVDVIKEFKLEYPLFIGAKFIYSKNKLVPNEKIRTYFEKVQLLYAQYPQLVVGFDLVGQEDKANPLKSYAEQILHLPDDLKPYFHAGETNWFGSIDENLIDAVLLGSRRIGHGFALPKHPKLIDFVKSNDIAVEVNPISNQVLKLVNDMRNHPAAVLFAQNVPIVISSDDPSFWEVLPLSHDFYFTFLGIASQDTDLRTLKQLALNSILYSSLEGFEKLEALMKWQMKWDTFIDDLIRSHS
ncbi:hypothetical protein HA402_005526 [Bradysia odoriphaga]|nr:hypothetical protein HA402_005526 [Bradysia odoriphaga]